MTRFAWRTLSQSTRFIAYVALIISGYFALLTLVEWIQLRHQERVTQAVARLGLAPIPPPPSTILCCTMSVSSAKRGCPFDGTPMGSVVRHGLRAPAPGFGSESSTSALRQHLSSASRARQPTRWLPIRSGPTGGAVQRLTHRPPTWTRLSGAPAPTMLIEAICC
jgi:hypothetical protein